MKGVLLFLPVTGCRYLQSYVAESSLALAPEPTIATAVSHQIEYLILRLALAAGQQLAPHRLSPLHFSPAVIRHVKARRQSGAHPAGLPTMQHSHLRRKGDVAHCSGSINCAGQVLSYLAEVDLQATPLRVQRFRFI